MQADLRVRKRAHVPLMMAAGLMLLAGLWGGLSRLGWHLPQAGVGFAAYHGPLMIGGFLGTLIGLERAMAMRGWWAYGAPLSAALGALAVIGGAPRAVGQSLILAGSLWLTALLAILYFRHLSAALATIATGGALWAAGNALWLAGFPFYRVAPWWAAFLVLTIAGERLELSRLLRLSAAARAGFFLAHAIVLLGLLASLFWFDAGIRGAGVGLVLVAAWLFRYDFAWRTVSHGGLYRFMAVCLLLGYMWLGVGGLLWAGWAPWFRAGPVYDAMLHAIFLGFVFSMIFAHAPIIFPSITGMVMPFQAAFYGHLVLLHASLLLRVGADLAGWPAGQRWGGLLNVLALLAFLVNNVRAVRIGEVSAPRAAAGLGRAKIQ
jgi:hypothetical protein